MSAFASALGSLLVKFTADATGFSQGCQQAQASVVGVSESIAQAAGPMGKLQGQIDSLGSVAAGSAGKLLGALGLAGGIAAIGKTAFDSAMMFEQAEARIARATGASGDHLASLKASFEGVYKSSAASSDAIASAMSIISQRTDATGPALENLTKKMIALARVSNEDVGAIGPVVTRVFGDWSIATDRQAGAMDFLRAASQQTGTTVSRLAEQVVYAGAPLRLLGYNFEQATALIGKFEKEGVNTELVLGGMKAALQKFAKEGVADPAAEWQKFVEGVQKGTVTMSDLIEQVGAKRGPDLYRAIVEGRFQIQGMTADLAKAARDGSSNVSTLTGEFTKLKHYIQTDLGTGMLEFINQTKEEIATVQRLVTWFQALMQVNKDLIAHPFSTKTLADMPALNPTPGAPSAPGVQSWMLTSKTGIKPADNLLGTDADLDSKKSKVDELAQALQRLGVSIDGSYRAAAQLLPAWNLVARSFEQGKVSALELYEAAKKVGDAEWKAANQGTVLALEMLKDEMQFVRTAKAMDDAHQKMVEQSQAVIEITDQLTPLLHAYEILHQRSREILGDMDAQTQATQALSTATAALAGGVDYYAGLKDDVHSLGITMQEDLDATVDKARKVVNALEEQGASVRDLQQAWRALLEAQKAAHPETWTAAQEKELQGLKVSIDGVHLSAKQLGDTWGGVGKKVHDILANDIDRALLDVIFQTGKLSDAFKRMGEDVVGIILHKIIAQGLNKLLDSLSQVGGLVGKIAGWLGGGSSGGGGVLGTSVGAAGGAASTIGGAASSSSGAAGAGASTALSSVLGIAGLGVSIASGIVSGIQGARTNDLLAEIEASTRYTWLAVGGSGTAIAQMAQNLWAWAQNSDKLFWGVWEPLLTGISANTDSMVVLLSQIASSKGGAGGGAGINITVNGPLVQVSGSGQSADAIAAAVMRAIPTQLKRYTNSFAPAY